MHVSRNRYRYKFELSITIMEKKKTDRGFDKIEFTDIDNQKCSLQKSSIDKGDLIWFGVHKPNPVIMASKAKQLGVSTTETTGWVDYPIPDDVLLSTRMHLSREQVAELLPVLKKFVETGEI